MIRTIKIGEYILVQGFFVRTVSYGNIEIWVNGKTVVGEPVNKNSQPIAKKSR